MNRKFTVQVRVRFKDSHKSVTGYSSYNSTQSYQTKFNNAVLHAWYIDRNENHRHSHPSSDTPVKPFTVISHKSAYASVNFRENKKKNTRKLHKTFTKQEHNNKKQQLEREKLLNKVITRKEQQNEIYGKRKQSRENNKMNKAKTSKGLTGKEVQQLQKLLHKANSEQKRAIKKNLIK